MREVEVNLDKIMSEDCRSINFNKDWNGSAGLFSQLVLLGLPAISCISIQLICYNRLCTAFGVSRAVCDAQLRLFVP